MHDLSVHERMHLEQMGYANNPVPGPIRPVFDRNAAPSFSAPIPHPGQQEGFTKGPPSYRNALGCLDPRMQFDPHSVVSPTGSDSSQGDLKAMMNNDSRHLNMASNQERLNVVPASPSTDSVRSMIVSSPGDQRNFVASSPADTRSFPASPLDNRNMVPQSPASEHSFPVNSPVDQR